MDLTKLTLDQLKVVAYDQIANLEQTQRNLRAINGEIEKRGQAVPVEVKPEIAP